VIPSERIVKVDGPSLDTLESAKEKTLEEFDGIKGDLEILIEEDKGDSYSKELTDRLLNIIRKIPTGVNTMMGGSHTVESSNNLAYIKDEKGHIKSEISLRSSNNDRLTELKEKITRILDEEGFLYEIGSEYPGWEYKEDSKLRPLAQEVYKKFEGKDFETIVIHAGLECGAIYEKYPNLDIISIGPNISGAHSPKEQVEIASVERVYDYLKELLKSIK